ncbi:MAG TPA: HD domain-containing protein [Nocardioides sp.]|nr:HD domain-containing protein [Nocardioides sp.]
MSDASRCSPLSVPQTPAATAAVEVARLFYPPALLNHCFRSYHFAAGDGRRRDIAVDDELLFVAALLHDLGLVPAFDAAEVPFEITGGKLAWIFAAGAGWTERRRARVEDIVIGHMRDDVAAHDLPERHLLRRATGLDIVGRHSEQWPEPELVQILTAHPRLDLNETFSRCFEVQADRMPDSAAATSVRSGIRLRLEQNPLNRLDPAPLLELETTRCLH